MTTLTYPRKSRVWAFKLGSSPKSPAVFLKEAIEAALETSFEEPISPKDICPDHLHPLKPGAVKEYEKVLKQLYSENFNLKLELYFRDEDRNYNGHTASQTEFFQLQVKTESLRKELDYKNKLLRETLKTLQQLENKYGSELDLCQSQIVPDFERVGDPEKYTSYYASPVSFLSEVCYPEENGKECEMNIEPEMTSLLQFAASVSLKENQDSTSPKRALQDLLQKLDEPLKQRFICFLKLLCHLKVALKEKDDRIKALEMAKIPAVASDSDSTQNSLCSFVKDEDVKLMEQELNSLHQAIREKEAFIQELLEKQSILIEESKVSTEQYMAIINGKNSEMEEKDAEIKDLLHKVEQLQQKAMERSFDSQLLSDDLLTRSQMYQTDYSNEEMSRKVSELEKILLAKEIQISDMKLTLSKKDVDLEVLQKNLKDTQNELVRLRATASDVEQLQDFKNDVEVLRASLEDKDMELSSTCSQLRHLSELLDMERRQNAEIISGYSLGGDESIQKELETLRKQLEDRDVQLQELRKKMEEPEAIVSRIAWGKDLREKEIETLQEELQELNNQLEHRDIQLQELRNKMEANEISGDCIGWTDALSVKERELLLGELEKLRKQLGDKDAELCELRHKYKEAEANGHRTAWGDSSAIKERELFAGELEVLQKQLEDKEVQLGKLRKEVKDAEVGGRCTVCGDGSSVTNVESLQKELHMLRKQLEDREVQMHKLKKEAELWSRPVVCEECNENCGGKRRDSLLGDVVSQKRQLECKDAELHELRNKYKESVLTMEREVDLKAKRIKELELLTLKYMKQVPESERRRGVGTYPRTVEKSINNNWDFMSQDDQSDSLVSISSSLHHKSLQHDFSKFGQTNDVLELKEQIFLLLLHNNQVVNDAKEKTDHLLQQLEKSRAVCKLLHDNLEELADFLESLLQCENISQLIRSSLTPDSLARVESLLSRGLDQSLSLSRSVWMANEDQMDSTSALQAGDQLDLEPSRDRDLSIMTITSHVRGVVASEENSSGHEKGLENISGRRSGRGGKLRLEWLDEMIQKGEKMCLELSRLHVQNQQLVKRLLNKIEGSDSILVEEVESQLKNFRRRIEETISHCAKLVETFKSERSQKPAMSILEKVEEVQKHVQRDNQQTDRNLNICLQELLEVKHKISGPTLSNGGDTSEPNTDQDFIGTRLLNVARETVRALMQQVLDREGTLRQKDTELSQWYEEIDVCFRELKHIQAKVGRNATGECLDEAHHPSELARKLYQAIRKTVRSLLQQIVEKEMDLKLGRERISELERCLEARGQEIKQMQEWLVQLQTEATSVSEGFQKTVVDKDEALRKQTEEQEMHRRQMDEEKTELLNSLNKVNALEAELKAIKSSSSTELDSSARIVLKLKEDNQQLRSELSQTKEHYHDLRSQVQFLKSEMERLSQVELDVKEKAEAVSLLESLLSDTKRQLELLTSERNELKEKMSKAVLELEEKDKTVVSMQDVISGLTSEVERSLQMQQQLEARENQMAANLRAKDQLSRNLQTLVGELERKTTDQGEDLKVKDALIGALREQVECLEKEKATAEASLETAKQELGRQNALLESKVSKEEVVLREEAHQHKIKQLEEWNVGVQRQLQQAEKQWLEEKDRLRQETALLKKKLKKVTPRKAAESSVTDWNSTVLRLQEELKEALNVNASLQLELKAYQHLSQVSCEDSHQKDTLLDLLQEMRHLRGELMRSVRANTKLQLRLEQYAEKDSNLGKPEKIPIVSSSDSIPKLLNVTNLEVITSQFPSRVSSESSLHSRVRELLGSSQHVPPDGSSSSNDDLRSIYSSPDLGIESDPNRDSSSTASGGHVPVKDTTVSFVFPEKIGNGVEDSGSNAMGNLQAFESLQKQISESLVVLRGMMARLRNQLHHSSNAKNPSKDMEYVTLKELDHSCYFLQVYLERSRTLLSAFRPHPQIGSLLEENSALRKEVLVLRDRVKEQDAELQKVSKKLEIAKNKKEGMERAVTKQLMKTRKVLKQAKCNLLEENPKQNSHQQT